MAADLQTWLLQTLHWVCRWHRGAGQQHHVQSQCSQDPDEGEGDKLKAVGVQLADGRSFQGQVDSVALLAQILQVRLGIVICSASAADRCTNLRHSLATLPPAHARQTCCLTTSEAFDSVMLSKHDMSVEIVEQKVSMPHYHALPCPPGVVLLNGITNLMPVKAHPHTITDTHVVHH